MVAVVAVHAAHVLLHLLPQRPALGVPEHGAGRMLVDVEQVQFLAELAVVALFGFLQHRQVGLEFFLAGPGGAVDALQHLVAVVAAPVGAGHLHQLEVLELAGAGHVRAAAQVLEGALAVQRHIFVGRDAGDQLGLVGLAHALEVFDGGIAWQHAAHHRLVLGGQFAHLLLDGGQVVGREGALVAEVVIKAVLDHRADGDLRVREQLLHRIGQQVGGGVADHLQPLRVLGGDDRQPGILRDRVAGVDQPVVHLAAQGGLGQAAADGLRHFGHRHRTIELALRAVGKRDLNHEETFECVKT